MLDITATVKVPTLDWSQTRVERLTTMWAQGFSATQISLDLGGVTRNAVLGKIHRLGRSKDRPITRAKPMRGAGRKPRRLTREPVLTRAERAIRQRERFLARLFGLPVETAPAVPLEAPTGQACSLQELSARSCRFPNGDPGNPDFHFCGAEAVDHRPYCTFHMNICYTPSKPSRKPFIMWGGR